MSLPNSKAISSASLNKIKTFRPPESELFMPDPDSSLLSVHKQSYGNTKDERDTNDVRKHTHDGVNSKPVNIKDLEGFIPTVSVVPTWVPTRISEQFAIYTNGATLRLYCYDSMNGAWRYVALS